jgi:hypothetical protein
MQCDWLGVSDERRGSSDRTANICLENAFVVKVRGRRFDLPEIRRYDRLGASLVRQFIYGLILGAASMYAYERLDPPAILAYLNSATESAVKSTSGYGGRDTSR